jgi:hypothetical protein
LSQREYRQAEGRKKVSKRKPDFKLPLKTGDGEDTVHVHKR